VEEVEVATNRGIRTGSDGALALDDGDEKKEEGDDEEEEEEEEEEQDIRMALPGRS